VSKIERSFLCVYGHFSQPPRGNPITQIVGHEPEAAPYDNWNQRVTDASYRPNAEIGNFQRISYSFGEALLTWLERRAPDVYQTVINSDKQSVENHAPGGNALATAYHHSILPLARKRDKRTQIHWGVEAFRYRFGRDPLGFWLPEMAVDTETLSMLAEAGIQYTVLSHKQAHHLPHESDSGPYLVKLPHDQQIAVFLRDDVLSSQLSFNIHNLGGAGFWSRQILGPARRFPKPLTLLAIEGETFGYHYAGEEQFLFWLVNHEAQKAGYNVILLDHYFVKNPPTQAITIDEPSSWSVERGLTGWATGYVSDHKDTTWKGALRRALDNVAHEVDRAYENLLYSHKVSPWDLRDAYGAVLFGQTSVEDFIQAHVPAMKADEREQLKALLTAQELAQRMYNSYVFTEDRLDARQSRYAIACAAAALSIAEKATGRELSERLLPDLTVVTSASGEINGADILRGVVDEMQIDLVLER
jgi:alpha-amylase/alpha-mannosidase (GH57 family)